MQDLENQQSNPALITKKGKWFAVLIIIFIIGIFLFIFFVKEEVNPETCEKISNQNKKDDCYANIARITNNQSLCEKTAYPENCFKAVAIHSRNREICTKIKNTALKVNCYFEVDQEIDRLQ